MAAAVLKALAKAPAERYPSAGAFAQALRKAWEAVQEATQTEAALEDLYAQAQEAVKAGRWGVVVSLCVEMRNLDPDYRDVGTLLTLAASRLAEEEQKRQQERELGEQYEAAVELLEANQYAEAIEALQKIADQAPDFRDVGGQLDKARAEMEKTQLYEAALAKLADECPDQACADLLALLKLDPEHADARARLLEATEGLLAQLQAAQAKLEKVGGEDEALRARLTELEAKLEEAQTAWKKLEPEARKLRSALRTAQSQVDAYDSLIVAMEDHDRKQMLALAEELAKGKRAGAGRLLARLQAEAKAAEPVAPPGDLWTSPQDSKEMVRIPAGEFLYGEKKQKVKLSEFWMDKTPVTNAEFARFVEATNHRTTAEREGSGRVWAGGRWKDTKGADWQRPGGPGTDIQGLMDHPAVQVSWGDAVAYAEWAGKWLPTEQEWEKAARGTDGRQYPWGDQQPTRELCNFDKNEGGTTPVGKYSPQGDSPYGCVDMAGNVWEWTASDYDRNMKVLRGGSWHNTAGNVCSANRYRRNPDYRDNFVGFRCARGSQ